jgi:hypothetical protein
MVEPKTVKLLAYLEKTDFICIIAHAVQLHSLKVPGNYREHLAKAIRVELARLIKHDYPLETQGHTAERRERAARNKAEASYRSGLDGIGKTPAQGEGLVPQAGESSVPAVVLREG